MAIKSFLINYYIHFCFPLQEVVTLFYSSKLKIIIFTEKNIFFLISLMSSSLFPLLKKCTSPSHQYGLTKWLTCEMTNGGDHPEVREKMLLKQENLSLKKNKKSQTRVSLARHHPNLLEMTWHFLNSSNFKCFFPKYFIVWSVILSYFPLIKI